MAIKIKIISVVVLFSVCASFCRAVTNYYVVPPPNATTESPFTNWAMAATNIQDVVNISLANDTIYITNGHYYLTNEISVAVAVIIKSFNNGITDPTNTIIDGYNYAGKAVTNRCLNISAAATIDGLTLTNGSTGVGGGGGCYLTVAGAILTNLIVTGNLSTNKSGGGIRADAQATIANCQIIANRTWNWGGGVDLEGASCVLKDSFIGWNYTSSDGAGVSLVGNFDAVFGCDIVSNTGAGGASTAFFVGNNSVFSNCIIRGCTGGPACSSRDVASAGTNNIFANCQIINNYGASGSYPAGGYVLRGVTYRNCLIANNRAAGQIGGLRISTDATGTVESCTIVSNYASELGTYSAGGVSAYDGSKGFFYNTIICSNFSATSNDMNLIDINATNRFTNCCCKTVSLPPAQGNIQSDPLFVDVNSGNYRLSASSPCINTGTNKTWMTNAYDLDGRPRIRYGTVDMGAYEVIYNGAVFKMW